MHGAYLSELYGQILDDLPADRQQHQEVSSMESASFCTAKDRAPDVVPACRADDGV